MPNVQFRDGLHAKTGERITEVWDAREQELLGVLYPTPFGVKFVSKYITNHPRIVTIDPDDPAAILISLDL